MTTNFCFVIFKDYNLWGLDKVKLDQVRYLSWQVERCPTTNRAHVQGYAQLIEVDGKIPLKKAQEILGIGNSRCERQRGTASQARDYTRKERTRVEGPWEHGVFEPQQGARTDLMEAIKLPLKQVAKEKPALYVQYHRGLAARRDMVHDTPYFEPWTIVRGKPPEGVPCYYIRCQEIPKENGYERHDSWTNYDYEEIASCCPADIPKWTRFVKVDYRGMCVNRVRTLYVY